MPWRSRHTFTLRKSALLGNPEDNRSYDKAAAFIVRLQEGSTEPSEDRLVSLLSTLFTADLSAAEKKTVISRDYQIPVTEHMERQGWRQTCATTAAML